VRVVNGFEGLDGEWRGTEPGPNEEHLLFGTDPPHAGLDPAVGEHAFERSQVIEKVSHEQPKLFT